MNRSRVPTPPSLLALAVLASAPAAGCPSDPTRVSLSVELAPSPDGAGECPVEAAAPLPAEAACLRLSICREMGPDTCTQVPLVRPEEDHGATHRELLFRIDADRQLRFDAQIEESASYRIDVEMYRDPVAGDGSVLAAGSVTGVRFGSGAAHVRLYQRGRWSCAGPRVSGATEVRAASRALHASMTLPNGEVLIFGGIVTSGVAANDLTESAPLQREIEVYSTFEDRFYPVNAGEGLGRVFFAATLMPGGPPYRIRVLGGFDAAGAAGAVRFDASQAMSEHGAPILPAPSAMPAMPRDIVYDPSNRSARFEDPTAAGLADAAFNAATAFGPSGAPAALVIGITDTGALANPRPTLVRDGFYWLSKPEDTPPPPSVIRGGAISMSAPRWGASVTRLAEGMNAVLVWGGNIGMSRTATTAEINATAGDVVVFPEMEAQTVAAGVGIPAPVVFHTATSIEDDVVVIAGGMAIGSSETSGLGVSTMAAANAATVFTWNRMPVTSFTTQPLAAPAAMSTTIFHTATRVPLAPGVADRGVLVAGGAARDTEHLMPQRAAGIVQPDAVTAGAWAYGAAPPLIQARFGHASALLPNGRVLLTGGLERDPAMPSKLRTISAAEILPPPDNIAPITMCAAPGAMDGGTASDSAVGGEEGGVVTPDAGAGGGG